MIRPSPFGKAFFLTFATCLLLALGGCEEKAPEPVVSATPAPQIPKITIPLGQLEGLSLNGKPVHELAGLTPDPQILEASDLAKAFNISNEKYLEYVLKVIQNQLQSGVPLKFVSVYFGNLPKKYAGQCMEDASEVDCLIEPVTFNCNDAIPQLNWNDETYATLCQRIGRLKAYNPKYLVALFDGDNTLWYHDVAEGAIKKGVEAKRILWEAAKAELFSAWPPPAERAGYQKTKTPYDYYRDLYTKIGPLWNYNFGALAFRGLSLKEIYQNFQELMQESYRPTPFPEMSSLVKYLQGQGIVTGIVSASPIFGVIPMVESLQAGIPLDRIEGLDVFVKDISKPESLPIRLSRLINQGKLDESNGQVEKFKNFQEVLEKYGDWVVVDVDQVINARGGKGVQSRSIARRHVADQNRVANRPGDKINIDDLRLVLIAGDNFAPGTDILVPQGNRLTAALEGGNDQGLSEGLAFLPLEGNIPGGTDILFIYGQSLDLENKVTPKSEKLENFKAYVAQQQLLRPNEVGEILTQAAVTEVMAVGAEGGFLKELPKATSETQPTTETQPSAESQPAQPNQTPKPGTTPAPAMTPTPATVPPPVPTPAPPGTPLAAQPPAPPTPATPAAPTPGPSADKLAPIAPTPPKLDSLP